MKIIENLALKACGYTLTILFMFYLGGTIADFTIPYIDFKTFSVIFLFGALISLTDLVFETKKIHPLLKLAIHYLVLFCAFTVIFVISGNIAKKGVAAIFSSLIIFTFFYIIIFTSIYFVRKLINKADSKLSKSIALKSQPNKEYKSLYKKED